MRKSFKNLGLCAAALLALAPSLMANTTAFADSNTNIKVSAGQDNSESTDQLLNLNLKVTNSADLKDGDSADLIKADVSSNIGQAGIDGKVYAIKTDNLSKVHNEVTAKRYAETKLESGVSYTLVATNAKISGLKSANEDKKPITYVFGDNQATVTNGTFTDSQILASQAFLVKDSNLDIQPYFTLKGSTDPLANGVQISALDGTNATTVKNVLDKALKAVDTNAGKDPKDSKAVVTTTENDIAIQLATQNIKVGEDGSFTAPATGFRIALTVANNASGKTAIVIVPFKGTDTPDSDLPQFQVNNEKYDQPRYFVTRADDGHADKDTATDFTDLNGKEVKFSAFEGEGDDKKDVQISTNGANFKTPGQYTVTLTATSSKGKTTTATYTLVVLGKSEQKVYANGASGIDTYTIKDSKAVKTDTTLKDETPITVEGTAQTVDGVSYTKVKTDDGKEFYVQTASLTKQANSQASEAVHQYTLMHAAYLYDKTGKRVGQSVLPSYININIYGNGLKIGNGVYYKYGDNQYIKSGNIFGSHRTFTRNAFIYKNNGKAYTYSVTVRKNGRRVKETHHNYYKTGEKIITFGAHFNIKGKSMYRISENQYIKTDNVSALQDEQVSVSVPNSTSSNTTTNK